MIYFPVFMRATPAGFRDTGRNNMADEMLVTDRWDKLCELKILSLDVVLKIYKLGAAGYSGLRFCVNGLEIFVF